MRLGHILLIRLLYNFEVLLDLLDVVEEHNYMLLLPGPVVFELLDHLLILLYRPLKFSSQMRIVLLEAADLCKMISYGLSVLVFQPIIILYLNFRHVQVFFKVQDSVL